MLVKVQGLPDTLVNAFERLECRRKASRIFVIQVINVLEKTPRNSPLVRIGHFPKVTLTVEKSRLN